MRSQNAGIGCVSIFVTSLKDKASTDFIHESLAEHSPSLMLNATSFAASSGGSGDPLAQYDCPVLQVVLGRFRKRAGAKARKGLGARDLAMNVVLPELDGRIHVPRHFLQERQLLPRGHAMPRS